MRVIRLQSRVGTFLLFILFILTQYSQESFAVFTPVNTAECAQHIQNKLNSILVKRVICKQSDIKRYEVHRTQQSPLA